MAQAGTTIDLQQQATGSGRKMGFWLAFLAVAVALAIGLAVAATQLNIGSSGTAPVDRSYDQVEQLRGGASISSGVQVGPDDRGLDGPKINGGGVGTTVTPKSGPSVQQFKHAPGRGPLQ
jgi:hypothetical protein